MYAPLAFMAQKPEGESLESFIQNLSSVAGTQLTAKELLDRTLYPWFMVKDDPKFTQLEKQLLLGLDEQFNFTTEVPKGFDPITEMRDILALPIIFEYWERNKQVYKPDREFAEELIQTEETALSLNLLGHLPFQTFYVDLTNLPELSPSVGAFVHVHVFPEESMATIVIDILTNEGVTFSYYGSAMTDEKGVFRMKKSTRPENNVVLCTPSEHLDAPQNIHRNDIVMLVTQLLIYLASKEPDVEESTVSKKTYKPSTIVRNKFSEVRTWDVGVRMGNAIREYTANTTGIHRNHSGHASPRAHVRRAHWQRYHVGKGRTETIVKWIPPVFVGKGQSIPATIHEVSSF